VSTINTYNFIIIQQEGNMSKTHQKQLTGLKKSIRTRVKRSKRSPLFHVINFSCPSINGIQSVLEDTRGFLEDLLDLDKETKLEAGIRTKDIKARLKNIDKAIDLLEEVRGINSELRETCDEWSNTCCWIMRKLNDFCLKN
jgi:hypothetical protein